MLTQIVSLVVLVPMGLIMLIKRTFMCLFFVINAIFVSLIPSPSSPWMFWTRIVDPSNGHHVDEDGSQYEDVYCFSEEGIKYSAKEMEEIREGFGALILIIMSISWYYNLMCCGIPLSLFLYFVSCTHFMKPGEYWTPLTGLSKKKKN